MISRAIGEKHAPSDFFRDLTFHLFKERVDFKVFEKPRVLVPNCAINHIQCTI